MKFKKTLLAAALMITGFSVQAANVVEADVIKYANSQGKELLYVKQVDGPTQGVIQVGWYERQADNTLKSVEYDTSGYTKLISSGQVQVLEKPSTSTPGQTTGGLSFKGNVDQNNYWSYGGETTTTTTVTEGTFTLEGQLVNTTLDGKTTPPEDKLGYTGVTTPGKVESTKTSTKKDVQVGNITIENRNTSGLANYDFKLDGKNVQGTLATIKTEANSNTAVSGLTGNGLAVLDVPKDSTVDLEKGTVTTTSIVGNVTTKAPVVLTAYDAKDGKRIVEFNGKYYVATDNNLNAYTGDTSAANLTKIGLGTADEKSGGDVKLSVNTGLVSNKNVTYGESVTTKANAGEIAISSTNPVVANSTSGNRYAIQADTPVTVTSKDVVTGIIAVDEKNGSKTYGLQATNVVDNKVTAQTTVTAEGIKTTGDIKFVDAVTQQETSVKGYLNDTANRLNSRLNDVKETA